jgi:hypothetical protein
VALAKIKPLPGNFPQTQVSFIQKGGEGEDLLEWGLADWQLGLTKSMKEALTTSIDIDAYNRNVFCDMVARHDAPYSADEEKHLAVGLVLFYTFVRKFVMEVMVP